MEEWILTCEVRQLKLGTTYLEKGKSIRVRDLTPYLRYLELGALSKKQSSKSREPRVRERRVVHFPDGRVQLPAFLGGSNSISTDQVSLNNEVLTEDDEMMLRVELMHNRVEDLTKHLVSIETSLKTLDKIDSVLDQLDENKSTLREVLVFLESLKEAPSEEPPVETKKKSKRASKKKSGE